MSHTVERHATGSEPSEAAPRGPLLLLVEDDDATRRATAANLAAHGYGISQASSVAEASRRWEAHRPDLILLDLGLPDRDGISVVRRVRAEATTPILVLSARDAEREKVAALEAGADDYVTKPFGMGELRARIAALLRRAAGPAADAAGIISLGPVAMDLMQHEVSVRGTLVELTPREYELLKVMLSQPGRVLTRGRLLRAVWGASYDQEAHYLHVYVSRLRRKLLAADPSGDAAALIVAEPGVGYRVVADVVP
jgi:two-component system, OmpR family, KDP operon response regulator KdpE